MSTVSECQLYLLLFCVLGFRTFKRIKQKKKDDWITVTMYTVGHKKRATLFWTITSAFLDGFQHFVYQRKK